MENSIDADMHCGAAASFRSAVIAVAAEGHVHDARSHMSTHMHTTMSRDSPFPMCGDTHFGSLDVRSGHPYCWPSLCVHS